MKINNNISMPKIYSNEAAAKNLDFDKILQNALNLSKNTAKISASNPSDLTQNTAKILPQNPVQNTAQISASNPNDLAQNSVQNSPKISDQKSEIALAKLREQTDEFEAFMLKNVLDLSIKTQNSLFGKDAGDEIYNSMYNDAMSKALSGGLGFSQILYDYLKERL